MRVRVRRSARSQANAQQQSASGDSESKERGGRRDILKYWLRRAEARLDRAGDGAEQGGGLEGTAAADCYCRASSRERETGRRRIPI